MKPSTFRSSSSIGALDLHDVLFPHLVAVCIFDDRHAAVHLVELQIFVDRHTFSGLDVIEHDTFI